MKKKILSILVVAILVVSLSVPAYAAGSAQKPGLAAGEKTAKTGDPAEVAALLATVTADRATILTIKANNMTLASQLKTTLANLKSSGATVPEETLTQLKALKDQLKSVHDQFAATKGELESQMESFRQFRQAKDFENAAAVLNQVITIQQTRITLLTQIGELTQQMLGLVSGIQ